jgi:hypothetical protein
MCEPLCLNIFIQEQKSVFIGVDEALKRVEVRMLVTASSSRGGQQGCKGGKLKLKTEKSLERNEARDGEYREKERRGRRFPEGGDGLMC